ncbi:MAG: 30S ribosomal protein S17 [Candidatus Diapherotrites archaeon]
MDKKNTKISVRGALLEGKVVSTKMAKTAIVEIKSVRYVPKYERYEKVRSKIKAHNPENIAAKEGDIVKIGETRKLSKTKSFIIMEVIKRDSK